MEKIRLLLVDDETDFLRTIAKRMQKRGIHPEQAENGDNALSILKKKDMDVVVLDMKMPGMDGIEVLQHIKEDYPQTEVILLTGHVTTQDGVEGIKKGAFDYLRKPVELEHLLGKIKQAHDKILRKQEKNREADFRRKMEQQMIATERLASLGTLAAGVAHEINNPLAIMNEAVGWMKLILNKEEMADMPRKQDFDKGLSKIEKSIERAKRITHQLLGVVRENDSTQLELDLNELLEESSQLVNREAKNKNIKIIHEIDPSLEKIWCDPYKLRQVLINLITNAVHATGDGGQVIISLKNIGEKVAISVSDTGEGIPKENQKRIFEPFFSTKSPAKGTGLGLFVTRGIIEKLGGSIELESQVGKGSSFLIQFPKLAKINDLLEDDTDLLKQVIKSRN
ncbi:two-component system, NtrC family, sensor kinase [Candidatus Magnetomoraceae bacterium gMMP-15]